MGIRRHLAFDLGAESGRAIAGILENGKLKMEEIHRFPTQGMLVSGTYRWNIYRLYEEVLAGLKAFGQRYGQTCESIGVDTWGVDYGLLDREGNIIELPYHYRDARTADTEKAIENGLGKEKVYELTGIQFMPINTLNQLIGAKAKDDKALQSAESMLFIGDLLHYLLCGNQCAEYTAASTSQMYNPIQKGWEEQIFKAFDIPAKLKPEVVYAGDTLGLLHEDIARAAGINRAKIIAPAVHDTASAATAIPAQGDDWGYISSGTWCMVGLETDEPVINQTSFEMNISNSAGSLGKSLFLKNVMGLWIIQQCRKAWNRHDPRLDYRGIVKKAQKTKPFTAFIDPDDLVFLNPEDAPQAVVDFIQKTGQGLVDPKDTGTISRIVYESLALKYKYVMGRLTTTSGKTINRVHILGGGTQNRMLNQFSANALGMRVITGPVEATAMGNLLMQAYGCGEIQSLAELRSVSKASSQLDEYVPRDTDKWQQAYQRFIEVCGLK